MWYWKCKHISFSGLFFCISLFLCCCDMKWRRCQWRRELLSFSRLLLRFRRRISYCGRLVLKTVSLLNVIQERRALVRDLETDWRWTWWLDRWPSETSESQTPDILNCKSSTANRPHSEDSMWLSLVSRTAFINVGVCTCLCYIVGGDQWRLLIF